MGIIQVNYSENQQYATKSIGEGIYFYVDSLNY